MSPKRNKKDGTIQYNKTTHVTTTCPSHVNITCHHRPRDHLALYNPLTKPPRSVANHIIIIIVSGL